MFSLALPTAMVSHIKLSAIQLRGHLVSQEGNNTQFMVMAPKQLRLQPCPVPAQLNASMK